MSGNEQETENKEVTNNLATENALDQSAENKEGTDEKHEVHDHHHSAAYAESVVHSVVNHVLPHHRDLDL